MFDTEAFRSLLKETDIEKQYSPCIEHLFSPFIDARKQAIGTLVNYFITSVICEITDEGFENPLLKYNVLLSPEAQALLDHMIGVIYRYIIDSQESRTFEYGGQMILIQLFKAINSNPKSLLDLKNRTAFEHATNAMDAHRVVCDYIANMTDEYAYRLYERLFGSNTRTIFERL